MAKITLLRHRRTKTCTFENDLWVSTRDFKL